MLCCRIVNGIKNKNIKNSLGAMIAPRIKTTRRFTANNHPQFIQKISKLRFFNKVHNIVDHNLVNPANTA